VRRPFKQLSFAVFSRALARKGNLGSE